jgi:hypothetical protein
MSVAINGPAPLGSPQRFDRSTKVISKPTTPTPSRTVGPPSGWDKYPNLRRRPHAPSKGRGRLQRQIARAFLTHGAVLTSSDIYRWCERWQSREFGQWERWSIVRILDVVADRCGRDRRHGAIIWRLKQPAAVSLPPRQIEIIGELASGSILPIDCGRVGPFHPAPAP